MTMHRTNKSRRHKGIFDIDPFTGKKTVRPIIENMPWFSHNRVRVRRRRDLAALARRVNR